MCESTPNGDRPALHVRGASDHFDVTEAMYDEALDAPIVHLGGTGLLNKLDGDSSVRLLEGPDVWAPPVISRGKLLIRDLNQLICLDIAAEPGPLSAAKLDTPEAEAQKTTR